MQSHEISNKYVEETSIEVDQAESKLEEVSIDKGDTSISHMKEISSPQRSEIMVTSPEKSVKDDKQGNDTVRDGLRAFERDH